ncbi:MAG: glycosyltransferase [Candidatus Altiarchaeota archaeon]|nr:glycosyltransferase [Candidatus Altiarchaeota archaeon]
MKILIVIYMFPPVTGGGEQGAFELARTLVKMGHEVHVATTHFKGLRRSEVMDGVRVHRIIGNPFLGPHTNPQRSSKLASSMALKYFMIMSMPRLLKLIKREEFDVVNAHFILPAGLPATDAGFFTSTPVVTTLVGGDLYTPGEPPFMTLFRKLATPFYRFVFSHSTLTAISTDTANRARGFGCKKEIHVTPYGIDPKKFYKAAPDRRLMEKLGLEKKTVLISVCRLSKRKGLGYLLEALPRVIEKERDLRLLIVGDGPEKDKLQQLTKRFGLQENVIFVGSTPNDELIRYYNLADIFVLPSLHEGMGIVFLEAMACGLPVVTTKTGGMTDFVVDGKTGLLVEAKNSKQLADALIKVVGDRGYRERLSRNVGEMVKGYTWEKSAERYLRAYEEAMG